MIGLDIILGGVSGLIGNAFTTYFKFKNAKMEYTHKEKMVDLETQAMIQEAQMQIKVTETRIEGEIELADAAAFNTSQKVGSEKLFHEKWIDIIMANGNGTWTGWFFLLCGTLIAAAFAFTDWLNGIMRPVLTLYLLGGATYITYLAWQIMQSAGLATMTTTQAVDIFQQVSSTMIYLSVSATTWWLGDRSMSKFLQNKGKKNNTPSGSNGGKRGGGDVDF